MHTITGSTTPAPDGTTFNEAPHGWRKCSIKEFSNSIYFFYDPDFTETRQILRLADGTETGRCIQARLYWFYDKTGVAIESDHRGKISYYLFGCTHDYKALSAFECRKRGIFHGGACFHVSECSKCGHVNAVDSSD